MRNFDRLFAVVLIGSIVSSTASILGAPSDATAQARFSFSEVHMGAPWKIVLYAADEAAANQAAQSAYARIEQINRVLSDYDPDSELSRLGDGAPTVKPVPVSEDLWRVLEFSQRLSEASEGAFDITIGP